MSKRSYQGIPLGLFVRKQIAKTWIFRIRRGNGYFGANMGELYQDKYSYFVPTSINNTSSQPIRDLFAQAVLNWQSSLSEEEKNSYNQRATRATHMSGYNLSIQEYILANE